MSKGPWKNKGQKAEGKTSKSVTPEKPKTPTKEETQKVKPSTSGREITPGAIVAAQEAEAAKAAAATTEEEGEVLDLTDAELEELSGLLFQETGNLALRILKRHLITDQEGKTFGKLSRPKLRQLLKDKIKIGWTAPLIYACLVVVSKPLTPEGEKLKKEHEAQLKLKKEMELANNGRAATT